MQVFSCPVCGNPPVLSQVHDEFVINCIYCSFDQRLESITDGSEDFMQASRTRNKAIERWNNSTSYYLFEYGETA